MRTPLSHHISWLNLLALLIPAPAEEMVLLFNHRSLQQKQVLEDGAAI